MHPLWWLFWNQPNPTYIKRNTQRLIIIHSLGILTVYTSPTLSRVIRAAHLYGLYNTFIINNAREKLVNKDSKYGCELDVCTLRDLWHSRCGFVAAASARTNEWLTYVQGFSWSLRVKAVILALTFGIELLVLVKILAKRTKNAVNCVNARAGSVWSSCMPATMHARNKFLHGVHKNKNSDLYLWKGLLYSYSWYYSPSVILLWVHAQERGS